MNARQWLGRARGIDREIDMLLRAKRETRDRLLKITQSYVKDSVSGTKDPHRFDQLIEIENTIDQRVDALLAAKQEISEAITQKIKDWRQRQVLYCYYVRCISMEQIAVEQKYSYRQVRRFHRAGLEEFESTLQNGDGL